jgi:hypothetical protein
MKTKQIQQYEIKTGDKIRFQYSNTAGNYSAKGSVRDKEGIYLVLDSQCVPQLQHGHLGGNYWTRVMVLQSKDGLEKVGSIVMRYLYDYLELVDITQDEIDLLNLGQ